MVSKRFHISRGILLIVALAAIAAVAVPLALRASTATPTGTKTGQALYVDCLSGNYWAGTFNATIEGAVSEVYCIDTNHSICYNQTYQQGPNLVDGRVVWILNNFYPTVPGQPSDLSTTKDRASAVQLAIWHFTDGCNFPDTGNGTIKGEAWDIIEAAENQSVPHTPTTLTLTPSSATNYLRTPLRPN